jgi:hypothetical protein
VHIACMHACMHACYLARACVDRDAMQCIQYVNFGCVAFAGWLVDRVAFRVFVLDVLPVFLVRLLVFW